MNIESVARLCFAARPLLWALAILLVLFFAYLWFGRSILGAVGSGGSAAASDPAA